MHMIFILGELITVEFATPKRRNRDRL